MNDFFYQIEMTNTEEQGEIVNTSKTIILIKEAYKHEVSMRLVCI